MLPCSISLEQKKAMSLEIDTLKSLLENKTSTYITITNYNYSCIMCLISGTQQNGKINDEVNVQLHAMTGISCIILCVYLTGIYRR